jgi:hypothetical protein
MAIRPTNIVQKSLDRVRGAGADLLNDASQQAENLRNQIQNKVDNTIQVLSGENPAGAVLESASEAFKDILPKVPMPNMSAMAAAASESNGPIGATENILKSYASYNYIVTFACLTVNEINFPDSTYRARSPQVTVLRSGGGAPGKAMTAFESSEAQLEYFIDDIEMDTVIAPTTQTRTSNATVSSFTVMEPYSMGLFLQTLMIAANKAGHADYLKAPYALIIEFTGYDDDGRLSNSQLGRRVFPISLNKVDFDVNGSGSRYTVRAHAWNENSLSSSAQSSRTDIKITGNTVTELLQTGPLSLTNILNQRIREKALADGPGAINKDEYVIMFPKELSSSLGLSNNDDGSGDLAAMTVEEYYARVSPGNTEFSSLPSPAASAIEENFKAYQQLFSNSSVSRQVRRIAESSELLNDIGKSTIVENMATGGAQPFGQEAYVKNAQDVFVSDNVQISNDFRTFQFQTGTTIEQIIEEIVILSTYGQKAATELKPDSNGMIPWFRVHTQTFLVSDEQVRSVSGQNPKIYVYAVVPYLVHSSVFNNSSQPSVGIQKRKDQAAKQYDYIYTGQNDDIIDFEINFNNSFFKAVSSGINSSGTAVTQTRDSTNNANDPNFTQSEGAAGIVSLTGNPNVTEVSDAVTTGSGGGGDADSPKVQVARMFNEAIVNNSVDLVTMDLTILGDPYYLADSGQGNYSSPPSGDPAYTADGTMDYQRGEVEVNVNFRTPIDYPTKDTEGSGGNMIFPTGTTGKGDTVPVNAFGGLYKVNTVKNSLTGGKFTQVLKLIRRPNQATDVGQEGSQGDNNAITDAAPNAEGTGGTQNPPPATTSNPDANDPRGDQTAAPNAGGSGATPASATGGTTPATPAETTPAATTPAPTPTPTPVNRGATDVWGFER